MGGWAAQYPVVTAAQISGGGMLPVSPHKVPIMMQHREAESKVARRPLRQTAMYLRECGISHTKKKLGLSFTSLRAYSAAEGVEGGRGNSVCRYWLS
jgi:hypothetical protein